MSYEALAHFAQFKTELFFNNAAAFLRAVLNGFNGELDFDSLSFTEASVDATPVAHTAAHAPAEVSPLTRLGDAPVDKDGFTPDDLKDGSTRNPDLKSNLDKAADDIHEADPTMPEEKLNAIKAAMKDPNGWTERTAGELNGKRILMADATGAREHELRLPKDTVIYEKQVEYTVDGKTYKETLYVPKDCANLSIDPGEDVLKAGAPAPVEVPPGPKEYEVRSVKDDCTGSCEPTETLGVVTRSVPADAVWNDENGDGKFWEEHRESRGSRGVGSRETVIALDGDEFKGLSPETVRKDYAELVALGYKGDYIVYNITDAEGKNIVFCVKVDAEGNPKSYSLFFGNHEEDVAKGVPVPDGHGKKYELYTSGKMLMEDLSKEKLVGSK